MKQANNTLIAIRKISLEFDFTHLIRLISILLAFLFLPPVTYSQQFITVKKIGAVDVDIIPGISIEKIVSKGINYASTLHLIVKALKADQSSGSLVFVFFVNTNVDSFELIEDFHNSTLIKKKILRSDDRQVWCFSLDLEISDNDPYIRFEYTINESVADNGYSAIRVGFPQKNTLYIFDVTIDNISIRSVQNIDDIKMIADSFDRVRPFIASRQSLVDSLSRSKEKIEILRDSLRIETNRSSSLRSQNDSSTRKRIANLSDSLFKVMDSLFKVTTEKDSLLTLEASLLNSIKKKDRTLQVMNFEKEKLTYELSRIEEKLHSERAAIGDSVVIAYEELVRKKQKRPASVLVGISLASFVAGQFAYRFYSNSDFENDTWFVAYGGFNFIGFGTAIESIKVLFSDSKDEPDVGRTSSPKKTIEPGSE